MRLPTEQLTTTQWLSLPMPVRMRLVRIFEIPRSSGSRMEKDGIHSKIVSDGYTHDDLLHITIPKMREFLGLPFSEEETYVEKYFELIEQVLDKVEEQIEVSKPTKQEEPTNVKMTIEVNGQKFDVSPISTASASLGQSPVVEAPRAESEKVPVVEESPKTETNAPYGLKKDGTPKSKPGKK